MALLSPSWYSRSIARASLAIVSPGVPPQAPAVVTARDAGVPVISEVELALWCLPATRLIAITGTNGIIVPPDGYLRGLRDICDRYGIVLIFDEVMSGFGRTGKWLALEHWGVKPDLITFAKGSNSGYVPVGGVIISDPIAHTFDERVFPGGLTYSGHPLAAASIVATIDAMREEGVVENAMSMGQNVIGPGLRDLQERHKIIGEVRGLGTFWAVDLVTDRKTKAMLAPYGGTSPAMGELVAECRARGLLPFTNFNRIHVVPPCNVTDTEAKEGLAILDEVFALLGKYYTGE